MLRPSSGQRPVWWWCAVGAVVVVLLLVLAVSVWTVLKARSSTSTKTVEAFDPSHATPVFRTSTDTMRAWLTSIHPDLATYAPALVANGHTLPERLAAIDDEAQLEDIAQAAGIRHDVHIRRFVEGAAPHRTPTRVPASTYTTLYRANAGWKAMEEDAGEDASAGSESGSYHGCVTADPAEASSTCAYVPMRVGEVVWARYTETEGGNGASKWAEARVTAVYPKDTLPRAGATDIGADRLLQQVQRYQNDATDPRVRTTDFVVASNGGEATTPASLNPQGYFYAPHDEGTPSPDGGVTYPVEFASVPCVTVHLAFVDDPHRVPADTVGRATTGTAGASLRTKYDTRVRARDVRRHPPPSIVDEAMLACVRADPAHRYAQVGWTNGTEAAAEAHSRHRFAGVCSVRGDGVNALKDVHTTGEPSNVYERDDATLDQTALQGTLTSHDPASGATRAKRTCPVVASPTVVQGGGVGGGDVVVPTACPCASSSLSAAEVQDFLNRHRPREFQIGPQCTPKGPRDGADAVHPTSCPGQYDIPCRQRPQFTDGGEAFCERLDTQRHQCTWYERSDALDDDARRQRSPTMTGCYDADACLFQDEGKCEDKDHKDRCKWKAEWAQCVPHEPCPTTKPVTVDDFHKLRQSGPYEAAAARRATTRDAKAEHAQLRASGDAIGALYASATRPSDDGAAAYTTLAQRLDLLTGKAPTN